MSDEQIKNCGTCTFWYKPEMRVDFRTTVSYETDSEHNYELVAERQHAEDVLFGACESVAPGWGRSMSESTPLAVVMDASEYQAILYTREEFFCALWKLRPSIDTSQEKHTS